MGALDVEGTQWKLKFNVLRNDVERERLLLMKQRIKEVFVNQLLKMPRPYMSRLVLDRRNECSTLLKVNPMDNYVIMR